ncbi:hypothetical protein SNOG_07415 [Parastagonospora nodorum SN15]|uniref:Uncharacterized protein n=1 Tax=Phaeosphaeria nodorum (strain SN15 / ATCC MYA-4574 / FGSC 10173) TaxID=321614 RepID=Q0ULE9_PHANO|nr:hypothetical protein SNOG_07415 [Parastagonospora nodorum SN15]EAT84881.1 hypothetical protein SNOG_07415 [Parastagonospora nodorum SN15]
MGNSSDRAFIANRLPSASCDWLRLHQADGEALAVTAPPTTRILYKAECSAAQLFAGSTAFSLGAMTSPSSIRIAQIPRHYAAHIHPHVVCCTTDGLAKGWRIEANGALQRLTGQRLVLRTRQ